MAEARRGGTDPTPESAYARAAAQLEESLREVAGQVVAFRDVVEPVLVPSATERLAEVPRMADREESTTPSDVVRFLREMRELARRIVGDLEAARSRVDL